MPIMSDESRASMRRRVQTLQERGVEIETPESVTLGGDLNVQNIEAGVKIGPGTVILGSDTLIGAGTEILGAARIKNCMIGRRCTLHAGEYLDSVLLDGCSTVGWARVRGHSAWEEGTQAAHNVDTKTTVLGYKTTLGSLINFCNVLMLGGTSPRLEVGAEVGSGTINFNFLPYGPTVGALIKPSTVVGSMESPFLSCADAPVRYDFIGGHTSIIAPVVIGLNCVIAAKARINPGIYGDDVMISGGNPERTSVVEVARVRVLKDIRPKYRILVHQLATTAAFKRWCELRTEWAEANGLDDFEKRLFEGFGRKVELFYGALESYGNSVAEYLLASDGHSRPEHLGKNKELALFWKETLKPQIRHSLDDRTGYAEGTGDLSLALGSAGRAASGSHQFYDALARLNYSSPEVIKAREYFLRLADGIIRSAAI
jgi:carbonic anhydrase/acetyltransferase-like protein (isoleucine patch superfamily)